MVFVETSLFTRVIRELMGDDEYAALQMFLMAHPEAGKVIRGSGGIRKLRWNVRGRGKSGGARVVYYWASARDHIYLLTAYTKSEHEDIDAETLKKMRRLVESLR